MSQIDAGYRWNNHSTRSFSLAKIKRSFDVTSSCRPPIAKRLVPKTMLLIERNESDRLWQTITHCDLERRRYFPRSIWLCLVAEHTRTTIVYQPLLGASTCGSVARNLSDCAARVAMEATGVYWMPLFRCRPQDRHDGCNLDHRSAGLRADQGQRHSGGDGSGATCAAPDAQATGSQTQHVHRIEKTLTEANIKLGLVISDIMGASRGRRADHPGNDRRPAAA